MPGCHIQDDYVVVTQEVLTVRRNHKLLMATAGILYLHNAYMTLVIVHSLNYVPSCLSVTKLRLLTFAMNRKTQPM